MREINLHHTPWSAPGCWQQLRYLAPDRSHRLVYDSARKSLGSNNSSGQWRSHLFQIELRRAGHEIPYQCRALPTHIELTAAGATAELALAGNDQLVFKVQGADLAFSGLKSQGWSEALSPTAARVYDFQSLSQHDFRATAGTLALSREPIAGNDLAQPTLCVTFHAGQDTARGAVHISSRGCSFEDAISPTIEQTALTRQQQYQAWLSRMPTVSPQYAEAAEFAWYMLWNQQVSPDGLITRPAILMSRNSMNQVWHWDACFSAMALAHADVKLAWDQVLLHFDQQNRDGALPDHISDFEASYGWVKPPVHGWIIRQMIETTGLQASLPYLEQIYEPLTRWTRWWYAHRDSDGDGLCQYMNGNDSGWDNSTVFDQGYPTEGPDLGAWLLLQIQFLAEATTWLGRPAEAEQWRQCAQRQFHALLKHNVRDGRFISPLNATHQCQPHQSLLTRMPIILGRQLPADLMKNLLADLSPAGPFLTLHGLATESPQSPKFQSDGYWRGPIWAPPTYIAVYGLRDAGHTDLAADLSRRWCDLCLHSPGMWENYDALTGQGLRCPAYSWSAAVFLLLAHWLHTQSNI